MTKKVKAVKAVKTTRLYPAPGTAPRHPLTTRRIDQNGENLFITPAIARMIRDGDLVAKKPKVS